LSPQGANVNTATVEIYTLVCATSSRCARSATWQRVVMPRVVARSVWRERDRWATSSSEPSFRAPHWPAGTSRVPWLLDLRGRARAADRVPLGFRI